MPFLLCHHLEKRTRWGAVITAESSVLGCSAEATVPLPDRSLAPSEAVLYRQGDRHLLRDLAERGRVLVNGALTREAILKDGDRIQMGNIVFVFLENAPRAGKQVSLDTPLESWVRGRHAQGGPESQRGLEPSGTLEPPAEAPRPGILQSLVVTFAVGCLLGILVPILVGALFPQTRPAPSGQWIKPPGIRAEEGAGGRKESLPGSSAEDPLRKLRESLNGGPAAAAKEAGRPAGGRGSETGAGPVAQEATALGPPPPTALGPALPTALGPALPTALGPALSTAPAPAKFELAPLADPVESRRSLFRLFLDVAGRPPTRGEARDLARVGHDVRWRRARELCLPSSALARAGGTAEAEFQLLLGRAPTAEETEEMTRLTTPDRPAAFWITSLAEYRRADRRRPRGALERAASFIVDFLDRPPASEAELDLVVKALDSPGAALEVARVLAHSGESRIPGGEEDCALWWEEEHFRFFLRPPTDGERAEIPRRLDGLAKGERRRWFLCVLAIKKEYESY
jgi:hypothetical protein